MQQQPRAVLGRGLDSLLPAQGNRVVQAKLETVRLGRYQPRLAIDPLRLEELADSIRQHGILQPLIVTEEHDGSSSWYELVAGERRWRAAKAAGLDTVPVIVRTVDNVTRLQMGLVENLQREDLGAVERAKAYASLLADFGMTQDAVARSVGKSRSSIANTVRLLELCTVAREALEQGRISEGHARALLVLRDVDQQTQLLRKILLTGMTVREAEQAAKTDGRTADPLANLERVSLEGRLRRRFGTKVQVAGGRKAGRLIIHYYSEEELGAIIDMMLTDDGVSRETSGGTQRAD